MVRAVKGKGIERFNSWDGEQGVSIWPGHTSITSSCADCSLFLSKIQNSPMAGFQSFYRMDNFAVK